MCQAPVDAVWLNEHLAQFAAFRWRFMLRFAHVLAVAIGANGIGRDACGGG